MSKKISYNEGDVFAIPLKTKFVIGLICRVNVNLLLVNIFRNIYTSIPQVENFKFCKDDIVFVKIISSLGIKKGSWQIIGRLEYWNRDEWLVPIFKRKDLLKKDEYHMVFYDDSLNEIEVDYYLSDKEILKYPDDGVAGYGFVEKKLEKILGI